MTLSLDSSKGVFSDRSFTSIGSSLSYEGSAGIEGFALRGRWRYTPDQDLARNIPSYYFTDAWYRWSISPRGDTLTGGRQRLAEAAGELFDGVAVDVRPSAGVVLGAFLGFRPDPFDFRFREDAWSTGVYSSWAGTGSRASFSRQALVFNSLHGSPDRTFLTWDAGGSLSDTAFWRQFVILDLDSKDRPFTLTNYSLQAGGQPARDLRATWQANVYRNIFYNVGSAGIPTDTSALHSTSVTLAYTFIRSLINTGSAAFSHRDLDHRKSFSYSDAVDFLDLLGSGVNANLTYSGADYYNAYLDSFSAALSRQIGGRAQMTLSSSYQRNIADTFGDKSKSTFWLSSLGGSYIVNDRYDVACNFQYQEAHLNNGPTEGLGFIRDPQLVGSSRHGAGYNLFLSLLRRF
ncbi:MAG: hypothetical protein M1377_01095 [Deltaproteobacteria bacterium]|nr:hypothetical protein [Deltaproteobacteria bacterium]